MTRIDGSTALVTGGCRGLGKAFVDGLLRQGARKVYATSRQPLPSGDPRIETVQLEVTDPASVAALAAHADDVSIVVNNAGVLLPGTLHGLLGADMADIEATFETNVFGALRVARAFAPVLAANGGGTLVDLHSVLSWASGTGAYGASKAAFWSVTNSLRVELAQQGTQVLGVHLGFADTEMTAAFETDKLSPAEVAESVLAGIEQGRTEVLVDAMSHHFKAALAGPPEGLMLPLAH